MVDRLEELLAMVEDEEEEDEREDGPALADRKAPAVFAEDGGEAVPAGAVRRDVPGDAGETELDRAAGEAVRDNPAPDEKPETGAVWRLKADNVSAAEAAWRAPAERAAGDAGTAPEDRAAGRTRLGAEYGGEAARTARREDESGLEGLYQQAVRASRPAAPQAQPVEQARRTVRAEEPGRAAALTVDELDRAVRRDSRRYDGGMTIF